MKIVPKLTLALVAGTCVILAVNGYFRVRREIEFFEADRVSDHEMIGRSIVAAAAAAWKSDGEASALSTVEAVNSHFSRIRIRWLASPDLGRIPIAPGILAAAPAAIPMTRVTRDASGESYLYTFVPLDVDGRRRGAVELSEPATVERQFVHSVLIDAFLSAGALAVLSAALSFVMGQWLVGAPVRAISDKARRIGQGDFGQPLTLRSKDELAELAGDVNTMCDRLQTTIAQLRHADRLATVGKLAAGVAHELGTPLNVVSARAEMIAEGEATVVEAKDYARVIMGAADRMTKIIRQLLQFARRGTAQKAMCDFGSVVHEAVELLRPLAGKRSVHIELTQSSADTAIEADAAQLQQVIMNLVMNGIQSMPSGGEVELRVEGAATITPPADIGATGTSYLCLCIEDHGSGISEEDMPRIFEPFFTTKDVGEGTGLGLAVAYGIVRDHGGWIGVDSHIDRGTTFSIFLPRRVST